MANMSYCRFQNTVMDLEDCLEKIDENGSINETLEQLSREEKNALIRMATMMREFYETYEKELDDL